MSKSQYFGNVRIVQNVKKDVDLLLLANMAKVNKVFKTFPLALTNTLGLGGIAVIALFCM